ncbi:hypothetical protein [Planktothricoides sp. SR001]|uniref:hypothetical protein n=1 Tax=Planktothricoides sp. SR001 TaxID=1705388 RepID=UPI0006C8581D|nr:hypothetical protein [Planktothricoides sp. SR001]
MSNISDLSITLAEVSRASNLKPWQIRNIQADVSQAANIIYFFWFILITPIVFSLNLLATGINIFIVIIIMIIYFKYIWYCRKKNCNKFKHFLNLYRQFLNFNSLIESAEALDEAGRSGGSNRLENREKVIKALTSIRADLISALRIEKAFRENPNFSSSSFTPNLEPLQFLQLSEQSSEYGRLFNEALQIGMNVQEEMQTLQRR